MIIKFGYTYNIFYNTHVVLEICNFKYDLNDDLFKCKELSLDNILCCKKIRDQQNAAPRCLFVENETLFLGKSSSISFTELMLNVE